MGLSYFSQNLKGMGIELCLPFHSSDGFAIIFLEKLIEGLFCKSEFTLHSLKCHFLLS